MNKISLVEAAHLKTDLPPFRSGDTINVHFKVVEGDKERIQDFEGIVISRRGCGIERDDHRSEDFERCRRRTDLPRSLTAHRKN